MPIYCASESTYSSSWRKTNLPVHSKFSGRCRLAVPSIQQIDRITSNELDKTGAARYPHLPAGPVSAASLASLSLPPDRVIRQVSTRAWVGKDSRFSAGEPNDEIDGAKSGKSGSGGDGDVEDARKRGKDVERGDRGCRSTLLAFGTSSCSDFIRSAILSLRSCEMDSEKFRNSASRSVGSNRYMCSDCGY